MKSRDADGYAAEALGEALAEDEPRYLRRDRPVEIKRRKFGKSAWRTYLRVFFAAVVLVAALLAAAAVARFLYASPRLALAHPSQIAISGQHYLLPGAVLEIFAPDRGHSILRIPLDERRREIMALPWAGQATVRRVWPNRIAVEITERVPVAFLRDGADTWLVDASGVILERPLDGDFHFPVVVGLSASMPLEDRAARLKLFQDFVAQVSAAQPKLLDAVNEVDLADAADLAAVFDRFPGNLAAAPAEAKTAPPADSADAPAAGATGANTEPATPEPPSESPLRVYLGGRDYGTKLGVLLKNITQWRAQTGRVDSVDMRFGRQAVINPALPVLAAEPRAAQRVSGPEARSRRVVRAKVRDRQF